MDLSSKTDAYVDQLAKANSKAVTELSATIYEYRESPGVEALGKYLSAKRDEYLLDVLKIKASNSSPVEIAFIQGKIKAIGDVIASLQQQMYLQNKKVKPPKTKKVRSRRQRKPAEAGAAI